MKAAPLHLSWHVALKPPPAQSAPLPTPSATQAAPSYTMATAKLRPTKPVPSGAGKAKAQTSAKPKPPPIPSQPSLVLSLIGHMLDTTLKTQAGVLASGLMSVCNDALVSIPSFTSVQVSACRWMPKGNLVIFVGLDTTRD
jgi:hypothetical protein